MGGTVPEKKRESKGKKEEGSKNIVYEDEDIVVMRAPDDEELIDLVKKKIAENGKPISWKELRTYFSGLAGEDRLRKVLIKLIENDEIIEMPDGTFALPGMEKGYIPRSDVKRVRPLAPRKFKARWGSMASRLRRLGIIEESGTTTEN
ncbi:MAG: hypothetical protein DJ555_00680 [Desulfurococcaceae archaeon]|nr:MAG: hypothetical protein DJ555_00680 [Desulfurococcaceae archaeon]